MALVEFGLELYNLSFPGSPACLPVQKVLDLPALITAQANSLSHLFLWRTLSNIDTLFIFLDKLSGRFFGLLHSHLLTCLRHMTFLLAPAWKEKTLGLSQQLSYVRLPLCLLQTVWPLKGRKHTLFSCPHCPTFWSLQSPGKTAQFHIRLGHLAYIMYF